MQQKKKKKKIINWLLNKIIYNLMFSTEDLFSIQVCT